MKEKSITLEALGEFPFTFYIEKASAADDLEHLEIEGIASTTNIDHDKERMSKDALRAMESTINNEGVPLRVEHQKEGEAIIGRVYKAWVDDRNQLHIRARLDKAHPVSPILHNSMKQGVKMGLSVGGIVKRALREFSESVGGMVKTFYDVALQEVSVTPRPANYDSWLIAKSIAKDEKEAEQYGENIALRQQFLFENSQLDYLQAFAKSVPDKAWHKVESPENNKEINKTTMDEKDKKEETEKTVTRAEFNSLSHALKTLIKAVGVGFEGIVKAMDSNAKDQNNPDKDKPADESATAKAAEESEETEKAEDDKKEETEKKADDKDDTYDLETLNRSMKTIDALTKKIKKSDDKEETEKAEDDEKETEKAEDKEETETEKAEEETETEAKKAAHPLDLFVASVTKMMEAVADRMEKSGKRVLGFEKSFIEDLQNNPEVQAEIMKLMKLPGIKKSVSMGVPYMVDKTGKRTPLVLAAPQKVEKSQDEPKNFRDLYKTKYSSTAEEAVNE